MFVFMIVAGMIAISSVLFGYGEFVYNYIERERADIREKLILAINRDIHSEKEINDQTRALNGVSDIQRYCRMNGINCRGYRWDIQIEREDYNGNTIYYYKTIKVIDARGREIYSTNNRNIVEERLSVLDSVVGTICTTLYNYQKAMREKASLDLNFLAMDDGGSCVYDGVNAVRTADGNTVSKQIGCSNGFVKIKNLSGINSVIGNLGNYAEQIEIANDNASLLRYCDTSRDKVVIRILETIQVCCGS
ncbi:MAG: hypothetical protein QXX95_02980 [Nitrososphaerales archaeon]